MTDKTSSRPEPSGVCSECQELVARLEEEREEAFRAYLEEREFANGMHQLLANVNRAFTEWTI